MNECVQIFDWYTDMLECIIITDQSTPSLG